MSCPLQHERNALTRSVGGSDSRTGRATFLPHDKLPGGSWSRQKIARHPFWDLTNSAAPLPIQPARPAWRMVGAAIAVCGAIRRPGWPRVVGADMLNTAGGDGFTPCRSSAHQYACSIGQLLRTSQACTSSKTIDYNLNEKPPRAYVGLISVDVSPLCTTRLLNSTMGYSVSRRLVWSTSSYEQIADQTHALTFYRPTRRTTRYDT